MSIRTKGDTRNLTAADWVAVAIEAIVEDGVAAVAVEPLAAKLGATKGSFYHHFTNRDALISAALEDWEAAQTEAVIARLDLIADPAERLRAVIAAAFADRSGGIRDAALLAAATHPLIKPVVERVTERRLSYFTRAFVELGYPKAQARRRARMLYISYIGIFDYMRVGLLDATDSELAAHCNEVLGAIVTPRSSQ